MATEEGNRRRQPKKATEDGGGACDRRGNLGKPGYRAGQVVIPAGETLATGGTGVLGSQWSLRGRGGEVEWLAATSPELAALPQ